MAAHGFTREGAKRIVDAVREVERRPPGRQKARPPHRQNPCAILARITSNSGSGTYGAVEVRRHENAGADYYPKNYTDVPDSRFSSIIEVDGKSLVPVGTIVIVHQCWAGLSADVDTTPHTARWVFEAPCVAPNLFPVALTQTSGSAGNASTPCSFTYTVKTLDASPVTLLTGASPVWNRPAPLGEMVAATHGTAYYDASGTCILYQADEMFVRLEMYVGQITTNSSGSYTVRRQNMDGTNYSPTQDVTATDLNGMDDIPLLTRVMVLTDGTTYRIWAGSGYMGGTPVDKSYSGEHQEAARTGVGFTRGASGFDTTFKFSVVVGEAYYDDSDEIWYEYRQDATIDSMGRVKLIDGTETRVIIDTPEICS